MSSVILNFDMKNELNKMRPFKGALQTQNETLKTKKPKTFRWYRLKNLTT